MSQLKAYFRTDNLETLCVVEVFEGVTDEQIKENNCRQFFSLDDPYDPDIIDCTVISDEDAEQFKESFTTVTVDDAEGNYTVTRLQEGLDSDAAKVEASKVKLYSRLYQLKGAKTEMDADSRDTTNVEAQIADIETQITDIYA